jgi:hypothetical protein
MVTKNRYDDLNTSAIAFATVVGCIVLLLTILSVRALCSAWVAAEEDKKLAGASYTSADDEISEQLTRLSGYSVNEVEVAATGEGSEGQDSEGTIVEKRIQIPLDKAKQILFEDLQSEASPST